MATYSLDQLREDVENKYGDFVVEIGDGEEVRLRSALRMPKADRDKLRKLFNDYRDLQEKGDDDSIGLSDDSLNMLHTQLRLLATDKKAADKMLKMIGDDLAMLSGLLDAYTEATQPGEVSAS